MWKLPGLGSDQSCSCRPMLQQQKHRIWATSVTYTTGQGNARSLTHWAGPGIKPTSSWILVRFVTTEPPWNSTQPTNSFLSITSFWFSPQSWGLRPSFHRWGNWGSVSCAKPPAWEWCARDRNPRVLSPHPELSLGSRATSLHNSVPLRGPVLLCLDGEWGIWREEG